MRLARLAADRGWLWLRRRRMLVGPPRIPTHQVRSRDRSGAKETPRLNTTNRSQPQIRKTVNPIISTVNLEATESGTQEGSEMATNQFLTFTLADELYAFEV